MYVMVGCNKMKQNLALWFAVFCKNLVKGLFFSVLVQKNNARPFILSPFFLCFIDQVFHSIWS